MDFIISHRFGDAKATSSDFLGLDNELAIDYGLTDKWSNRSGKNFSGKNIC